MDIIIKYLPVLGISAIRTLGLFLGAAALGLLGGMLVAMMRTSLFAPVSLLARGYVAVVQGTPVLLQLFVFHYGIALFGVRVNPMYSAIFALAVFASGFWGEIWRGAINAVPKTQWDAARSLGFSRPHALISLIAPQALWIALPASVGFAVSLLKTTSLASIIGIIELTKAGTMVANISFEPMVVYSLVAAMYFAMCWPMSALSRRLERTQNASR